MFDTILGTVRDATETTLRMQFELFRPWLGAVMPTPVPLPVAAVPVPVTTTPAVVVDEVQAYQKDLADFVTDVVRKQRALVDAQYAYALKVLDDAFQVVQTKDIDQFRKTTEVLWKDSVDGAVGLAETQVRDTQAVVTRFLDVLGEYGRVVPAVVEEFVPVVPKAVPPPKVRKRK